MNHLSQLRQWLASQKKDWPAIARDTNLSVKTLSRIVGDESYSCTMTTFSALEKERAKRKRRKPTLPEPAAEPSPA